jgi:sensor histidine kinase YesM
MKRPKFSISAYWLCQVAGWLSMILIELVNYTFFIVGKFNASILYMFLFCAAIGILLTHGYRSLIKKKSIFAASIPYIWMYAFLSTLAISLLMTLITEIPVLVLNKNALQHITFIGMAGSTVNWMRYVGVWVIIYFMYKILEQNTAIQKEKFQLATLAKTTELELLKSQLNPHFLFNALNSIKALVHINPEQSRDAIVKLSELLRFTLQYGKEKFISLGIEMDEVKKYLELEQLRFGKRLTVRYAIHPETLLMPIPPALLLTLVENAIKHGVARQMGATVVEVLTAPNPSGLLTVTVLNAGKFEPGSKDGIGLKHLRKRLEELYRGKASFHIEQKEELVRSQLQIPIHEYSNADY